MLENILELPAIADETAFFGDGCPVSCRSPQPHQRVQAGLSTGAGGVRLASVMTLRVSALVVGVCGLLPTVLSDLSGPLGESIRCKLPGTPSARPLGKTLRDLAGHEGLPGSDQAAVLPSVIVKQVPHRNEEGLLRAPGIEVFGGHDWAGLGSSATGKFL